MTAPATPSIRLALRTEGAIPYRPPARQSDDGIVLRLDSNEGPTLIENLDGLLASCSPEVMRRYPDASQLTEQLAARVGIAPDRVIVTCGGDEALDRCCRIALEPGRQLLLHTPGFEMTPRYARLAGAAVCAIEWREGVFPVETFIDAIGPATGAICITTPNNPTGLVASTADLLRIADAAPEVLLIVDLAYVEFADENPTEQLLERPNVVMVRTLSKAWGLAGLRLGYAIASPEVVLRLRAVGGPFPATGLGLAIASTMLRQYEDASRSYLEQVRDQRNVLAQVLADRGATCLPSQANFVLARFDDAALVKRELARRGVAVRSFDGDSQIGDCLRITCPGDAAELELLRDVVIDVFASIAITEDRP